MLFVWGIKGQVFNGTVIGGTGKFSGISGEFTRERLLAPNFSGAETFRISFPTSLKPDYYPCLLYTSPSPRDRSLSRMPSSA